MVARDNQGRFIKGASGNPAGRPTLAAEAKLADGIKAAASAEKVAALLDKLYQQGMAGDVRASSQWLDRVLGKPVATIDLSVDLRSLSDDELWRLAGKSAIADSGPARIAPPLN